MSNHYDNSEAIKIFTSLPWPIASCPMPRDP